MNSEQALKVSKAIADTIQSLRSDMNGVKKINIGVHEDRVDVDIEGHMAGSASQYEHLKKEIGRLHPNYLVPRGILSMLDGGNPFSCIADQLSDVINRKPQPKVGLEVNELKQGVVYKDQLSGNRVLVTELKQGHTQPDPKPTAVGIMWVESDKQTRHITIYGGMLVTL